MLLYEMLDVTLYYQEVWIYENNVYDQNMPIFKGTVYEARGDVDIVWSYLMCEVELYQCNTGILLIKVKTDNYEKRMEELYSSSGKWGREKEERPWRHSIEIDKELY